MISDFPHSSPEPIRERTAAFIARSYSDEAARAFLRFDVEPSHLDQLADSARAVLSLCRGPVPHACVLMSAMWAAMTAHKHPGLTVYQVAGDLLVDGHRVFGTDATEEEIARQLDRSNLDWDGHSWIAVGGFIGDLSVISTAHSTNAPPGLWTAIVRSFRDTNCLLCPGEDLKGAGLEYRPRYVVTKVQVDSLLLGADAAFELRRQQGRDRE